ncbi:hypothetical protein PG987_004962 [Apiospora arundinis]
MGYPVEGGIIKYPTEHLQNSADVPRLPTCQKLSVDKAKERIRSYERGLRGARLTGLNLLSQYDGFTLFQYLLRRREYDVLEIIFQDTSKISPNLATIEVGKVACLLAPHGITNLLETLINSDRCASQVISTCATTQHNPSLDISANPILAVAAQRELTNLDVLRLLVEKGRLAFNASSGDGQDFFDAELSQIAAFEDDDPKLWRNTALHELAKSRHWWHVARGTISAL